MTNTADFINKKLGKQRDVAEKPGETVHSNHLDEKIEAELEDMEELKKEMEAMQAQSKEKQSSEGLSLPSRAELESELEDVKEELQNAHDKLLRALAEMKNVQRHAAEDIDKARKYSLGKFCKELIVVVDNLERALINANEQEQSSALFEGVQLTLKMLLDAGNKFGLKQIDPLGKPFDPKFHEAISVEVKEGISSNQVISVLQKGYLLNDRLLRPALVTVSSE
jgi:molecular chaperone GrpE